MTETGELRCIPVTPEVVGDRADAALAHLLDLSRTRIQRLIEAGAIEIEESTGARRTPRKSEPMGRGWIVHARVPPPEITTLVPQDLPLEIIHEDPHLAVVNKAAGMVVHPAPGHPDGTLVNALLYHLRDLSGVGGRLRPGIVHRLDRDTSGLLVVAKTDAAHRGLALALKDRHVKRVYRALVWGRFSEPELTIDAPIARDPRDRKRMAVVDGGRRAVTHLRAREDWPAAQLLDVTLETGRTHQIRVHTAHLGHPVVGDALYGAGGARGISGPARRWAEELERRVTRQFLHAAELAFVHPVTGSLQRFEAPLPRGLAAVVEWARSIRR